MVGCDLHRELDGSEVDVQPNDCEPKFEKEVDVILLDKVISSIGTEHTALIWVSLVGHEEIIDRLSCT